MGKKIVVVKDFKFVVPDKLDDKWAPFDDYFQDYYDYYIVYTAKHHEQCVEQIWKILNAK
jgi:hypothetical protein